MFSRSVGELADIRAGRRPMRFCGVCASEKYSMPGEGVWGGGSGGEKWRTRECRLCLWTIFEKILEKDM